MFIVVVLLCLVGVRRIVALRAREQGTLNREQQAVKRFQDLEMSAP